MDYVSTEVMRKHIEVMYSNLNKLRSQMDFQRRTKGVEKALSRLVEIGSRVKKSAGKVSTKRLIDDVRG